MFHRLRLAFTMLLLWPAGCEDAASGERDAADGEVSEPATLPELLTSEPARGARDVARTAWLRLEFGGEPSGEALAGVALDCGAGTPAIGVESLGAGVVVVNPAGELPAGAECALSWRGPSGAASLSFGVAAAGEALIIPYDRSDATRFLPFPDDALLVPDAATPTGQRVVVPIPDRPNTVKGLFASLARVLPKDLDGFSALAPVVFDVPLALDRASLPRDEVASLDPFASIGLFDLDPASPTYLARLAFDLVIKDAPDADGHEAHVLMLFPTAPLTPRGRYAVVVTRRALVDATRPLAPSDAMTRALADASTPSGAAAAALATAHPALHGDDLALVLRLSVRSLDHSGDDLVAIRRAVIAEPRPRYTIKKVTRGEGPIAALVEGVWSAPDWREGDYLARDEAGHPLEVGTRDIPFVMALPDSARTTPAPLVMYQHGNPGSAEVEVPLTARDGLAEAGFAVAGFTDILNREILKGSDDISAYTASLVTNIVSQQRVPDIVALLDTADQLSFIRLLEGLGELDVLPVGAPDGRPDVDARAALAYLGISNGGYRGTGLVPFAPELRAAALVVGGGRFVSALVQQVTDEPSPDDLYGTVTGIIRDLRRGELFGAIALTQMAVDDQDWLTHASHTFRDRYPLESEARASVLVVEGLGDSMVPVYSTRSAATAMGLSQLAPVLERAPTLPLAEAATASGFLQYAADGLADHQATPVCVGETEGHYFAQRAIVPVLVRWFQSALAGAPVITP